MPSIMLKSEQRSVGLDIQEARTVHTRKIHSFGSKISSDKTSLCFYIKVEIQCTKNRFCGTLIELPEKNTRKGDFVINVKNNRVSRDRKFINRLNYYRVFRWDSMTRLQNHLKLLMIRERHAWRRYTNSIKWPRLIVLIFGPSFPKQRG